MYNEKKLYTSVAKKTLEILGKALKVPSDSPDTRLRVSLHTSREGYQIIPTL
jgi:hypothetical protein